MKMTKQEILKISIIVGLGFYTGEQIAWFVFDTLKIMMKLPLG